MQQISRRTFWAGLAGLLTLGWLRPAKAAVSQQTAEPVQQSADMGQTTRIVKAMNRYDALKHLQIGAVVRAGGQVWTVHSFDITKSPNELPVFLQRFDFDTQQLVQIEVLFPAITGIMVPIDHRDIAVYSVAGRNGIPVKIFGPKRA